MPAVLVLVFAWCFCSRTFNAGFLLVKECVYTIILVPPPPLSIGIYQAKYIVILKGKSNGTLYTDKMGSHKVTLQHTVLYYWMNIINGY